MLHLSREDIELLSTFIFLQVLLALSVAQAAGVFNLDSYIGSDWQAGSISPAGFLYMAGAMAALFDAINLYSFLKRGGIPDVST